MTYKLMKHQQASVKLLQQVPSVFDQSQAGCGKTLSALDAWAQRRRTGGGRLLVFAPKSCTKAVWEAEVEKFFPNEFHASVALTPKREPGFFMTYSVTAMNHDGVKWLMKLAPKIRKQLLTGYDTLIWDESDALRHNSARTKAAIKLAALPQWKYKACLSATPFNKSVSELFYQVMFLDGGLRLGKSFFRFRGTICDPVQVGPSTNHIQWEDKPDAPAAVAGLLQDISIRHKLNDVIEMPELIHRTIKLDLPPKLMTAYKKLRDYSVLQLKNDEAVGLNAATLSGKLLQLCLAEGTEVLTNTGWKGIETITNKDLIWDGFEWADCEGFVYNGVRETVTCWGVHMTSEHKVLTTQGWQTAQDIIDVKSRNRFNRSNFQLPNSNQESRSNNKDFSTNRQNNKWLRSLVMQVRVWQRSNSKKPEPAKYNTLYKILRVQTQRINASLRQASIPWSTRSPTIQQMDKNQKSLQQSCGQRLQKLWSSRNKSLCSLGLVPQFYRRHGAFIPVWVTVGSKKQQQGLLQGELPLGNCKTAAEQYQSECKNQYSSRKDDSSTCRRHLWNQTSNYISTDSTWLDKAKKKSSKTRVYDLVNVGKRNQFLVRNTAGFKFIVHNCSGSLYGEKGAHTISTSRYELAIELAKESRPTVIFYNYKHQRDELIKEAAKAGLVAPYIDGSVNTNKRADLVKLFQSGVLDCLLLQINSAAHGITLTQAARIVFTTPPYSPSIYTQAVGRIYRKGQDRKTESILLVAKNTLEVGVVKTLVNRKLKQQSLLELLE